RVPRGIKVHHVAACKALAIRVARIPGIRVGREESPTHPEQAPETSCLPELVDVAEGVSGLVPQNAKNGPRPSGAYPARTRELLCIGEAVGPFFFNDAATT